MRFQFKPVLTLFALLGLAILLWLGTWQWNKVGPKTALVQQVEAGLAQAPLPLSVLLADTPSPGPYRRVELTGTFRDGEPLKRYGANKAGEAGYHLYALMDTDFGPIVATYGWTPFATKPLPRPSITPRFYSAITLNAGDQGSVTPDNDAATNNWYWTDIPAMAAALGAKDARPFLLVLEGEPTPELQPSQYRVDIPNDHFEYALTWYGLALTLIGVYLAFSYGRKEEDHHG